MKKMLMNGNVAAAWAVRLCDVQVVPSFPVVPQAELLEKLAKWKVNGEWKGELVNVESERSALAACIGVQATGLRSFTASCSQEISHMFKASGMRLPIVMVNVSRGTSSPLTLGSDHNHVLAMRDAGWLVFFSQNNQEVLDTIIQAYKICEDVMLPAVINMEGFVQSHTREPVEIPDKFEVAKFLPRYRPELVLDPKNPMSHGVYTKGKDYMGFRAQQHKAQLNATKKIKEVGEDFGKRFGREYNLVEKHKMKGAKFAFVTMGAMSTTAKEAVNRMRERGKKVGLLRLRTYRPFPEKEIQETLQDVKKIAVIDNNAAPGYGGIVFPEIKAALYDSDAIVSDFIVGLGGTHIGLKDFLDIHEKMSGGRKQKKYWLLK